MDVTLRPGEALSWEWADRGKYHGFGDRPKRLCNGRMQYEPDLSTLLRRAGCATGWASDAHLADAGRRRSEVGHPVLNATPGPEHLGFHTITVRVQNGQGGVDMQGFDLEGVTAG